VVNIVLCWQWEYCKLYITYSLDSKLQYLSKQQVKMADIAHTAAWIRKYYFNICQYFTDIAYTCVKWDTRKWQQNISQYRNMSRLPCMTSFTLPLFPCKWMKVRRPWNSSHASRTWQPGQMKWEVTFTH
jgi:hypothetical protein